MHEIVLWWEGEGIEKVVVIVFMLNISVKRGATFFSVIDAQ